MPKKEDLSNVPASVLKQQRDAERKIEALKAEPTPDPVQNTDPISDPEPAPLTDPVDPKPMEPAQPVKPAIVDDQTSGQWEHKYRVLQGKYDKEVGDLRGEIASMKAMMERQTKIIDGLETSNNNAPEKNIDLGDDLNLEDYEGWGDEMKPLVTQVNTLKAIIKDQAAVIDGLKSNPMAADNGLADRVNSLESESRETRVKTYLQTLDTQINGPWRELNVDANFNAWLNESDPMSMMVRRDLLEAAAENLRGAQVASIFNQFISSQGKQAAPNVSIADVLPDGSGAGDDNSTPKPKVTEADVKQAQQDFIRGKITEEEYDKKYAAFQRTLRR